jgi:hypothetical protein
MCDEDTHTTYSCNIGNIRGGTRKCHTHCINIRLLKKYVFCPVRSSYLVRRYHTWVFPIRPCTTEELYFIPCFDGTWYQVQVILILKPGPGTGTCTGTTGIK